MPSCCIFGCSNNAAKGFKMFRVPSRKDDVDRRNIWMKVINRKDFIPSKHSALCQVHFSYDQFEPRIAGKLKPNAVPSLQPIICPPTTIVQSPKKIVPPTIVRISTNCSNVDAILKNDTPVQHVNMPSVSQNISEEQTYFNNTTSANNHEIIDISSSELETEDLPVCVKEVLDLPPDKVNEQDLSFLKIHLASTKKALCKLQRQKGQLEQRLSNLFGPDQMHYLEMPSKNPKIEWSEETLRKALQIKHSCGIRGYNQLISMGFPFPAERTLRRKLQIFSEKLKISEATSEDIALLTPEVILSIADERTDENTDPTII